VETQARSAERGEWGATGWDAKGPGGASGGDNLIKKNNFFRGMRSIPTLVGAMHRARRYGLSKREGSRRDTLREGGGTLPACGSDEMG
jgi:hypothetical protein